MRRFKYRLACAVVVSAALTGSTVPAQAVADDDPVKPSATDGANALSTFPEFAAVPDSANLGSAAGPAWRRRTDNRGDHAGISSPAIRVAEQLFGPQDARRCRV